MDDKLILHSDLNNFYASVECLLEPKYQGVPLAVAGAPEKRHGVVLAKNAIAKKAGVKTGDVIWEAEQKCPGLVVVPPHHDLYGKYSDEVFNIYRKYSNFVEPFGPDECWIDCSVLARNFGEGESIANTIKEDVHKTTGLTVSIGVSFTKPLAKLCSDLAEPNDIFIAGKNDFKKKLWGLDAGRLLNVGRSTKEKLLKMNIKTLRDIALADDGLLKKALGVNGIKLKNSALGIDFEEVRNAEKKRKQESVGHGMTTSKDILTYDDLFSVLCYLSEKIANRMINYGVKGHGVHIDLRSSALTHKSKQTKLPYGIFSSSDIADTALSLSKDILEGDFPPLRTISISVFDLADIQEGIQLSLFDKKDEKREQLELALNKIRHKYGKTSVVRGNIFGQEFIYDKTDEEDFLPFKR